VGYDVAKLPLGQLSDDTVKEGYKCLRAIETILNQIKSGKTTRAASRDSIKEHSN